MTEHEVATERLNRLYQQVSNAKSMMDDALISKDDRYFIPWENVIKIGDFLIVDMSKERWL